MDERGLGMKENEFRIDHMIFGFSVGAIASYVLLSFFYMTTESALMLIIFNFLFVSLTFPLNGILTRKLCLLLIGNIIGLVWNQIFSLFALAAVDYFGRFFEVLYVIFNPFLNLIWIVSFWSTSLTVLADQKDRKVGVSLDS